MPYNYESWKSERAIEAEDSGLLKAGQLARHLGVSLAAVRACCPRAEWHHVGGGYARCDYYSPEQAEHVTAACREFDAGQVPLTWLDCVAEWLAWPSFKVGRWAKNHDARPTVLRHEHVAVSRISPNTLVIRLADGASVTKRSTTRGLRISRGLRCKPTRAGR